MRILTRSVSLLALIGLVCTFPSFAQTILPPAEWQYTDNLDYHDQIHQAIQTKDGGYVVVIRKTTQNGEENDYDQIWAEKISSTGTFVWKRLLGDYNVVNFPTIKPFELQNGNLLIPGRNTIYHYVNGADGSIISTKDIGLDYGREPVTRAFAQLTNGTVAVLADINLDGLGHQVIVRYNNGDLSDTPTDDFIGGAGDEFAKDMITSIDGSSFVIVYSTPGGSVVQNYITTTETLDRILPFPAKVANAPASGAPDLIPAEFVKQQKTYLRIDKISDYLLVGTKAGKGWLATGNVNNGMTITTTLSSPIKSISTTLDGRILVATADSIELLNNKFDRIWRVATYKGLGVEFVANENIIVYGETDTRLRKLFSPALTANIGYGWNLWAEDGSGLPLLRYKNASFLDPSGSDEFGFAFTDNSFGDSHYLKLNGYLSAGSGFTQGSAAFERQGAANPPPTNWSLDDFNRDNAVEVSTTKNLWADFNNDGLMDELRYGDAIYLQQSNHTFSILNSSAAFVMPMTSALAFDVNNDSYVDVIDRTGKAIWLNSAASTFTKHGVTLTHSPAFAIELNGDGFIDFIGNNGATWYTFINNGSMTFTYTALGLSNPAPFGDVNNDGRSDIVAAQKATGGNASYFIYLNNGNGTFDPTLNSDYVVPSSYGLKPVVSPADYDYDGDLDLALIDDYQVLVMKNNQVTPNAAPSVPAAPTATRIGNAVTFSWAASTDDTTPANALAYNIYLNSGSTIIVSPLSDIADGKRVLLNTGNSGFAKQYKFNNLPVGTYQWGVQSIDKGWAASAFTPEQTLYITNNPTALAISPLTPTIAENSTAMIGTFTTTDTDPGETTFTYTLVSGTGSDDNALFAITGATVSAQEPGLNFESRQSAPYKIRVRTTDIRQGFFEKAFTITVTDVNESPTQISLSSNTLEENNSTVQEIGMFGAIDPDGSEILTYTLVAGAGDTDNTLFQVVVDKLKTVQTLDFEIKSSYSIRAQVKDKANNTLSAAFAINVTDVNDLGFPVISLDKITVTQTSFIVTWPAVAQGGASAYEVEVSKASDFATRITGYNPKSITTTSIDITGLEKGIVHFVRIRAAKLDQKSGYSNVKQQITKPANPTLTPDDVERGKDNFTARWIETTGADFYLLEVSLAAATDPFVPMTGFDPAVKVLAGADYNVKGLAPNVPYRYRVKAGNDAGESGYSSEKTVTTLAEPINPVPNPLLKIETLPTVSTINASITSQLITTVVSGGTGPKKVTFWYRGIMADGFNHADLSLKSGGTTEYEFSVTSAMLDDLGLEYYVEATDDLPIKATQATHSYLYRAHTSASAPAIPFASGFDGTAGTYQMFSVPFELADNDIDKMFDAPLNGPDKTQWRLFHYSAGNLQEYPQQLKEIKPGEGYWFNTIISEFSIKPGASTVVQANRTSSFQMTLRKGWNQIGNPYPFDINWSGIINGNTKVGPLNAFSKGAYTKPTILKVWAGAFVHATEDVTLSIPVTSKASARTSTMEPGDNIDSDSWELPIIVNASGSSQQSAIGMHPEASLSKDRFDDITVPRFIKFIEFSTRHDEFFAPSFSTDVVPTANSYEWTFTVKSNIENTREITWDMSALRKATSNLVLIDLQDRNWVDMKTSDHYSFSGEGDRSIKIIYTRDDEMYPGITLLGQSFPNPFHHDVSIPVLAEKSGNVITVEVLDVLGRRVKTISITTSKSGPHIIPWDGNDDTGSGVSSGMYFYRISGDGGTVSTKRMIRN